MSGFDQMQHCFLVISLASLQLHTRAPQSNVSQEVLWACSVTTATPCVKATAATMHVCACLLWVLVVINTLRVWKTCRINLSSGPSNSGLKKRNYFVVCLKTNSYFWVYCGISTAGGGEVSIDLLPLWQTQQGHELVSTKRMSGIFLVLFCFKGETGSLGLWPRVQAGKHVCVCVWSLQKAGNLLKSLLQELLQSERKESGQRETLLGYSSEKRASSAVTRQLGMLSDDAF